MSTRLVRKTIPNLCVLAALVVLYVAGVYFGISVVRDVFEQIDGLTGNLLLVIVAITLGILVERYLLVAASVIVIFALMLPFPGLFPIGDSSPVQIAAVASILLGFSSIANIFRHTRKLEQ